MPRSIKPCTLAPMTHPEPGYRKTAVINRFWMRFVAGKVSLFLGAVLMAILTAKLQAKGLLGAAGTYAMIAAAAAAMVGVFTWNFWPHKTCPQCGVKMRGRKVRPKHQKGRAMILCCERCKLFIDLGVSGD